MDKDLEKLSALYDGELSYAEIQEGLDKMQIIVFIGIALFILI